MPSKRSNPKAYLFHIRDNITLARRFVDGFDYDQFRNNQLVFYAVTRALEIISEALGSPSLRATAKQSRLNRRCAAKSGLLRFANKKQTVTTLILLEKLCTEKEKIRHGF